MGILSGVMEILLPVIISSIFAFFISLFVVRKQLNAQNVPRLLEFDECLTKALEIDPIFNKRVIKGDVSTKEAADYFSKLFLKCADVRIEYQKYRPYVKRKYRRKIDKMMEEISREHETIKELWREADQFDADYLEKHNVDPIEKLATIGRVAFHVLNETRDIIQKNIHQI